MHDYPGKTYLSGFNTRGIRKPSGAAECTPDSLTADADESFSSFRTALNFFARPMGYRELRKNEV